MQSRGKKLIVSFFSWTFPFASLAEAQQVPPKDNISWLKADSSGSVEVHPNAVESVMHAAPRLLGGQTIEFQLSPFASDFASSSAAKISLLQDDKGLFPTVVSRNPTIGAVIQRCVAMTAAVQPSFTTPVWSTPIAISPDGKLMLCDVRLPGPRGKYLDIMSLEGTPRIIYHFDPMDRGNAKDGIRGSSFNTSFLVTAQFLDANRFVTIDSANHVSLWMLGDGSIAEIYRFEADAQDGNCQVSADGRFVTGVLKDHIIVLDAKTGKCVRFVPAPKFRLTGKMSLSPDANRMLLTGSETLLVDLEKGGLLPCAPSLPSDGPAGWINDNLIFTGSVLYDVDHRNIAWKYQAQSRIGIVLRPGGGAWYMKNTNPKQMLQPDYTLAWAQIPDAKGLEADTKLQDAKLLAGPGSKVTIVQQMDILPKDQKDVIRSRLTDLLMQNDMTVAAAQPIKLVVEIKQASTSNTSVPDPVPGNPGRTAVVHIPRYQYGVSFEVTGRQFWQLTGTSDAPRFTNHKPGQTVAEAIKDFEEKNRPSADIFIQHLDHLPANIFDIADPAKVGFSDLSKQ